MYEDHRGPAGDLSEQENFGIAARHAEELAPDGPETFVSLGVIEEEIEGGGRRDV